jgi:GT2 family glycosyltransferase
VLPAGLNARLVTAVGTGPGAARNTGARAADAQWILFTDSDCTVDSRWILDACDRLDGHDGAVVQGDPTRYTRSTPLGEVEETLYGHMYATYVASDRRTTSMLDSRNLLVRRDVLEEAGGFDVSGRDAMAESRVLAARLAEAGHTFAYAEGMVVRHEAPPTVQDEMGTKFRHGRGRAGVWGTHLPEEADLALRYFVRPIQQGIDPAYVLPVHLAFLGGYAHEVRSGDRDLPGRVLQHIPGLRTYAAVIRQAMDWLAAREEP